MCVCECVLVPEDRSALRGRVVDHNQIWQMQTPLHCRMKDDMRIERLIENERMKFLSM